MQTSVAGDPTKWDDVVINESDDDELIYGETASFLKISKGYHDPLGIVKDLVDPQTDELSYSSELFNPMKYLLEIHNSTPLDGLERGLETMKTTVLNEEERLKKLVKDYFGDFVTARKTIEDLEKALADQTHFTKEGGLLLEAPVESSEAMTENLIAPLQENRENMYALQNSLQLFRKYRLMFPTIDNVEQYLANKQWDKLLKEYTKYKSTILTSTESNVVIDVIKSHMMEYIQKAIDELLSILYNSSTDISPEQQAHYISIVIGLDYDHVPELFLIQNLLQTYGNALSGCRERLLNSCELERIDITKVNGSYQRTVLSKLLMAYMEELSNRSKDMSYRSREVIQSMLKRAENVKDVEESLQEMMRCVGEILDLTYHEVEWVLGIDKDQEDPVKLLSPDSLLAFYDVLRVDMSQACAASFGALQRSAQKVNNTELISVLQMVQNGFVDKQRQLDLFLVRSFIDRCFNHMTHILRMSTDRLVLSPYQITKQMVSGKGEHPLLLCRSLLEQCFDGILRHLAEYETELCPMVMKRFVTIMDGILKVLDTSLQDSTTLNQAAIGHLLENVYTLVFLKKHLIEEPLAKYVFLKKDASLKEVYSHCTSSINRCTSAYRRYYQDTFLRLLDACFNVDWTSYRILQPMRLEIQDFLTSMALMEGDLALYMEIDAKKEVEKIMAVALERMRDVFQGLRNITEAAYCQLLVEISVMEKAVALPEFETLHVLLDKGYESVLTEETQAVVDKYISDSYDKMKSIIDPLS